MDPYRSRWYRERASLEDLVTVKIAPGYRRDPVYRQQLPMFGLNSRAPVKPSISQSRTPDKSPYESQRALSVVSDRSTENLLELILSNNTKPPAAGFRTSQFPKSSLTPELGNKLKVLSLYHAFMNAGRKKDTSSLYSQKKRNSMKSDGDKDGFRPRKHIDDVTFDHSSPPILVPDPNPKPKIRNFDSIFVANNSGEAKERKTDLRFPMICTSISPKNRVQNRSRESESSVQTPLAPVYLAEKGKLLEGKGQRERSRIIDFDSISDRARVFKANPSLHPGRKPEKPTFHHKTRSIDHRRDQ